MRGPSLSLSLSCFSDTEKQDRDRDVVAIVQLLKVRLWYTQFGQVAVPRVPLQQQPIPGVHSCCLTAGAKNRRWYTLYSTVL